MPVILWKGKGGTHKHPPPFDHHPEGDVRAILRHISFISQDGGIENVLRLVLTFPHGALI